ncbi:MAG: serine/threonine protein kinase [Microcoleus sp.]
MDMKPTLLNNRYRIIAKLGTGGFGETFLAQDTQMPSARCCVLKQLKPTAKNPQILHLVQQRFKREAAILELLNERKYRIPQLYAYFEESGQFYLVQEWIDGENLARKIQEQGLCSEGTVKSILISVLEILDYIHAHGIIHRDIKPDNILLRKRDGQPVLIDFGAVKETMATAENSAENSRSILIGTPGFMASEQANGRPIYASDLFSLGLTAIYLLTGKIPQELEVDAETGEFVWRHLAGNISYSLAAILDKAIRFHPRDRYATAREMLAEIQGALSAIPDTEFSLPLPTVAEFKFHSQQAFWADLIDFKKITLLGGLLGALASFAFVLKSPETNLNYSMEKLIPLAKQEQLIPNK